MCLLYTLAYKCFHAFKEQRAPVYKYMYVEYILFHFCTTIHLHELFVLLRLCLKTNNILCRHRYTHVHIVYVCLLCACPFSFVYYSIVVFPRFSFLSTFVRIHTQSQSKCMNTNTHTVGNICACMLYAYIHPNRCYYFVSFTRYARIDDDNTHISM